MDIRDILSSGVSRPMTSRPREEGVDAPPSLAATSSSPGAEVAAPCGILAGGGHGRCDPRFIGGLFRNPTFSSEGGERQEATPVNRCSLKGARRWPPVTVTPFKPL